LAVAGSAFAQNNAFTYQGRLVAVGQPANGLYDFQFRLADAATSGNYIGSTLTNNAIAVSNGLFATTLNFGSAVWNGASRWLEIAVRTTGSPAGFTLLSPRQPLTANPYAAFADNAGVAANLAGGGASLTNVPGSALQPGTVTSDLLSAATDAAYRATDTNAVQAVGDNRYVARTQGTGTETTITSRGMSLQWTNNFTSDFFGNTVPVFEQDYFTGTNPVFLNFGDRTASRGQIFINTGHSGLSANASSTEWQFSAPGHYAFGPGFGNAGHGHIQFGIGYGNYWGYWEHAVQVGPANPYGNSGALAWKTSGLVNGQEAELHPGILGRFTDTNGPSGLYELDIFTDLGPGADSDAWTVGGLTHGLQIYGGNKRGLRILGGLIQERAASSVTTSNCPLNFSGAYCTDLNLTATNVTFWTTNTTPSPSNYEPRVFLIHARSQAASLHWPQSWSWLGQGAPGAAPATLQTGQLILLQLVSVGSGPSNILASAKLAVDRTSP
jgi:hypothetical protein